MRDAVNAVLCTRTTGQSVRPRPAPIDRARDWRQPVYLEARADVVTWFVGHYYLCEQGVEQEDLRSRELALDGGPSPTTKMIET